MRIGMEAMCVVKEKNILGDDDQEVTRTIE